MKKLVDPNDVISVLLEADTRAARVVDTACRVHCGVDLRETMAKMEFDGSEQIFKCPACGVGHHFKHLFDAELSPA